MGIERPRDTSDLLPPRAQGRASRRVSARRRSAPHGLGAVGRHVARARCRHRHRARQHDRPRDHPRGPRQPHLHRARDDRVRRVPRRRRAVDARGGRARHRRPGRDDPGARAPLRPRRPRDPVLDAGDHRARHRRRQRAVADQPGAAHRPRRTLRLGAQPAPRPEQRPGWRRHGRDPEQAPGLPGRADRPPRHAPGSRPRGAASCLRTRAGICRRCSRRWSAASCGRCT